MTGVSRVFCVRPTATRTLVSQLFSFFFWLLCMQHRCSSALSHGGEIAPSLGNKEVKGLTLRKTAARVHC